ncbi:N-acetylneuraminate synthase family protein [Candidatus Pelagibacter sp.]|nr:N-acetylneuraminate synthase family protein [Candidatus Pelagibacter sp.]
MKLIAETAWHHEGDFLFMKKLVSEIATKTNADIIKMHVTLNLDEYMDPRHEAYDQLKKWIFNIDQWGELIDIVKKSGKKIMLLVNDSNALEFCLSKNPDYVEIHSVCLNDIFLLKKIKSNIKKGTKIVLGIGGTSIYEIEHSINFLKYPDVVIMFGFQNYPTSYENVNLNKIRKIMKLFDKFEFGYADHTPWNNEHNELITLLGAASGMQYIEKHVSTNYGEERVDWSAAISLEMFNNLHQKLKILEKLNGNGSLSMNSAEKSYSLFGPMKKAAILKSDISKGTLFNLNQIKFIRTKEQSDMSQLDIINSVGKKIVVDLKKKTVLMKNHFY